MVTRPALESRVKALVIAPALMLLSFYTNELAHAYPQPTHQVLTEQATQLSALGAPNSSALAGLTCGTFPGTKACPLSTIADSLGQAAYDEDAFPRSLAHFFDPQNLASLGLSTTISGLGTNATALVYLDGITLPTVSANRFCKVLSSPPLSATAQPAAPCLVMGPTDSNNWSHYGTGQSNFPYTVAPATDCGLDGDLPYVCSYKSAKILLFKAITQQQIADRTALTQELIANLGHVLHHIQDMAQPQHVRNEMHCDKPVCDYLSLTMNGFGSPSLFEVYVEDFYLANVSLFSNQAQASQSLRTLPTPFFQVPDAFWSDFSGTQGRGIADFTSYNFLSAGTGPTAVFAAGGLSIKPDPAHPQPSQFGQLAIAATCSGSKLPQPIGVPTYLTGTIIDKQGASPTRANAPLGDLSVAQSAGNAAYWPVVQNCVTYDQAMYLLVPQAIRYSAWFIDFLFRGSSSIYGEISADGTTLTIKNTSPTNELLNSDGTGPFNHRGNPALALYSDDATGNRQCVWSSGSISSCIAPPSACAATNIAVNQSISCSLGNLGSPPASGQYLLVYNGTMGYEDNQSAFATVQSPSTGLAGSTFTGIGSETSVANAYDDALPGIVCTTTITTDFNNISLSFSSNASGVLTASYVQSVTFTGSCTGGGYTNSGNVVSAVQVGAGMQLTIPNLGDFKSGVVNGNVITIPFETTFSFGSPGTNNYGEVSVSGLISLSKAN
jgi:hypothetical protein